MSSRPRPSRHARSLGLAAVVVASLIAGAAVSAAIPSGPPPIPDPKDSTFDTNSVSDVYVSDRPPLLEIDPPVTAFGGLNLGLTSAPMTITVRNVGEGPSIIDPAPDGLTIVGAAPGDFAFVGGSDTCSSVTLFPADECTIDVTFTPTATGPRDAIVRVTADSVQSDPGHGPNTADGSLTGEGLRGLLELTPDPLNFGAIPVGVLSAPGVATATNVGTGTVTIPAGPWTVGGLHPGDFMLGVETCGGAPLIAAATCTTQVRFAPSTTGLRVATLSLVSDSLTSPNVIVLVGVGIDGNVILIPNPVDFGEFPVGATTAPMTVTAVNIGDVDVSIGLDPWSVVGVHPTDFLPDFGSDTCAGTTLIPTQTCEIEITFTPGALGPRNAALLLDTNAPTSPHGAALIGAGIDPLLTLSPDVGPPGTVSLAIGIGFLPNTAYTLVWVDDADQFGVPLAWESELGEFPVESDGDGEFQIHVIVTPRTELGPRIIHAVRDATDTTDATAAFLVDTGTGDPPGQTQPGQLTGGLIFRN